MTWIAGIALLIFALVFLIAPALDYRMTPRIINPILVASLLMVVGFVMGNAAEFVTGAKAGEIRAALGIVSGVLAGVAFFLAIIACSRFSTSKFEVAQGIAYEE